jgi:DNA-binding protein H-NS
MDNEEAVKKYKGNDCVIREYNEENIGARRQTSEDIPGNTNSDFNIDWLIQLSKDVRKIHENMNSRLDLLQEHISDTEKRLTEKITDKLTKMFDKRLSSETAKLRKEIDNKIGDIRKEVIDDISQLNEKIEDFSLREIENIQRGNKQIECNVVVRNLPYHESENLERKVEDLLHKGLKLRDVSVEKVERKDQFNNKPGVVIVKCKDTNDKKKILSAKSVFKDDDKFRSDFISSEQTKEDRVMAANMHTFVNAIKEGTSNLSVRGTRVIRHDNTTLGANRNTMIDENRPRRNERNANRRNQSVDSPSNGGDNSGSGQTRGQQHGGHRGGRGRYQNNYRGGQRQR